MLPFGTIDWCAIAAACLVSLGCGILAAFAWGVSLLILLPTAVPEELAGGLVAVSGFMTSLAGDVIGGAYLSRTVSRKVLLHCLFFGIASMMMSRSIAIVLGEFFLTFAQQVYYLATIPAALRGGLLAHDL